MRSVLVHDIAARFTARLRSLNVAHGDHDAFTAADETLLEQFAAVLAAGLETQRLFARVQAALARAEAYADRLALLGEMGQLMNRSVGEDEAVRIMRTYVPELVPADGIVMARSPSHSLANQYRPRIQIPACHTARSFPDDTHWSSTRVRHIGTWSPIRCQAGEW